MRAPKGREGIRPTSAKVRAAIFNMLPPGLVVGARVLDAYAGTGALGIDALLREAAWADFVEQDPDMCRRIQESLTADGFTDRGHVYRATVKKALSFLNEPYDLIFMDPPYANQGIGATMALTVESGLLKDGALLVFEHASRVPPPEHSGRPASGSVNKAAGLSLLRTRRYGDTSVTFYVRGQAA